MATNEEQALALDIELSRAILNDILDSFPLEAEEYKVALQSLELLYEYASMYQGLAD